LSIERGTQESGVAEWTGRISLLARRGQNGEKANFVTGKERGIQESGVTGVAEWTTGEFNEPFCLAKSPSLRTGDLGYGSTVDMEVLLEDVSKLLLAYANAIEPNPRTTEKILQLLQLLTPEFPFPCR
jgi:hypothetical protein